MQKHGRFAKNRSLDYCLFPVILKRSCQWTGIFIYLDDSGVMGNLSNSPSTTLEVIIPPARWLESSQAGAAIRGRLNKKEVASLCNQTRTTLLSNLAVESPHTSVRRHTQLENTNLACRSQTLLPHTSPRCCPPHQCEIVKAAGCGRAWVVGVFPPLRCGCFFFPFLFCLLPSGGRAEADFCKTVQHEHQRRKPFERIITE